MLGLGYTAAVVLNLNQETAAFLQDAHGGGGAAGVTMNVGQTLLNDAEDGEFRVVGKAREMGGKFQVDLDVAAFRKAK